MKAKKPRQRKCSVCKEKFIPNVDMQPTCFKYECQKEYMDKHFSKKVKEKKKSARKELKAFNNSDVSVLKRKAQKIFNEYIRLRDRDENCISCNHDFKNGRQVHAGHYRPRGSHSLFAFNENNCFAQCSICNNHLAGNLVLYRKALIKKIGLKEVEYLENTNSMKRWSKEELQEIIDNTKEKIKKLKDSVTADMV